MIQSFSCKHTEQFFNGVFVRQFSGFERQAERRLRILDTANTLQELAGFPSNKLEALSGNRKGQYSIRINQQWRLCFHWKDAPLGVEIVDYH